MIQTIAIDYWIQKLPDLPIVDVRSPVEFERGHIPGAINIPLFSDEERAIVGKAYKQTSKEKAIALGYQFVNPKLEHFVLQSLEVAPSKELIVHCWRGGMRSSAFAAHLDEHGFKKVYLIENGYKAYRNHLREFFAQPFSLRILGGFTGSGKTEMLHCMAEAGEQIVDLEGLANHRGSAFGGIDQPFQPTTEQFENNLFAAMQALDPLRPVWIEDESNAIGRVNIPKPLFVQMSTKTVFFINIPQRERAKHLVDTYAGLNKDELAVAIHKIGKRLGLDKEKLALQALDHQNYQEVAEIMLFYYDKYYLKGVSKREPNTIVEVKFDTVNHSGNAATLLRL
jgi:tRNA 2-selenouridine synthase